LQNRPGVRRTCISLTDSPAYWPPVSGRSNRSSSARAGDAYRASIGLTQPAYMRVWLTGTKISSGADASCIGGVTRLTASEIAELAAVNISSGDKHTHKNMHWLCRSESLDCGNQCRRSRSNREGAASRLRRYRTVCQWSDWVESFRPPQNCSSTLTRCASFCALARLQLCRHWTSKYSVTWIIAPKVQCSYRFQRIVTTGSRRRSDDAIGATDWRRNTKRTLALQRLCTGELPSTWMFRMERALDGYPILSRERSESEDAAVSGARKLDWSTDADLIRIVSALYSSDLLNRRVLWRTSWLRRKSDRWWNAHRAGGFTSTRLSYELLKRSGSVRRPRDFLLLRVASARRFYAGLFAR